VADPVHIGSVAQDERNRVDAVVPHRRLNHEDSIMSSSDTSITSASEIFVFTTPEWRRVLTTA
jgi:hypothetical protein